MLAQVLLCGHAHVGGRDGALTPSSQTWGKDTWGGGGGGDKHNIAEANNLLLYMYMYTCAKDTSLYNHVYMWSGKENLPSHTSYIGSLHSPHNYTSIYHVSMHNYANG